MKATTAQTEATGVAVAGPRLRAAGTAALLLALCAVAFALRSIGFEGVFAGDEVLLATGDGQYHARLALYSFVNFPRVLTWDGYINYPDGSSLPAVPVIGFTAAAIARALDGNVHTLETVLAWWSPVTGALTPVPVYLAARCVAARGVALGAAGLVGSLPILAASTHVGNADHGSVQALLGATFLWLTLGLVRPQLTEGRVAAFATGLVAVRLVLVLLWSGSLLYVLLADGLIVVAGVWASRRDLLWAEAGSLAATAAFLLPTLWALPPPPGGSYSAVSLSWLHLATLVAAASVAGGLLALDLIRPAPRTATRLVRLVATAAAVALGALALPGPREGLLLGVRFLTEPQLPQFAVFELMPLLPFLGRPVGPPAEFYYGWFAWLVPLAPLAPLSAVRDAGRRAPALVLCAWTAVLALLAVRQIRYGIDFLSAGSICFALLLEVATRPLTGRSGGRLLRPAVAMAAGLGMLWIPMRSYAPGLRASAAAVLDRRTPSSVSLAGPVGTLNRFMQEVAETTPETSGFLGPGRPEYGILCRPRIGHALHYRARRASAADGMLYTLSPDNFAAVQRFFATPREAEAFAIAGRLRARYVVSMFFAGIEPGSMEDRLQNHFGLGEEQGAAPLQHFRLVTEGPEGGVPLSDLFAFPRPRHVVPYRLFEIVEGALLEVSVPPGTLVSARVRLQTPLGRRFEYEARAVEREAGIALLRLPYPTEPTAPTRALGPYRVKVGGDVRALAVPESAVREGARVRLPPRPGTRRSRVPASPPAPLLLPGATAPR